MTKSSQRWVNRRATHYIDPESATCCHPDCYKPAFVDMATTIPLCEEHVYVVYRETNRMLGTKTGMDQQYELLPMEAEFIPGPCPGCGTTGLLVGMANGIVECRAAACGYSQERSKFGAQRRTLMGLAAGRRSVVYYMRLGNRAKIGTSRGLAGRLASINPEDCMTFELGGRALEHRRHEQFRHLRVVGEWFDLTPELVRHVNDIPIEPIPA